MCALIIFEIRNNCTFHTCLFTFEIQVNEWLLARINYITVYSMFPIFTDSCATASQEFLRYSPIKIISSLSGRFTLQCYHLFNLEQIPFVHFSIALYTILNLKFLNRVRCSLHQKFSLTSRSFNCFKNIRSYVFTFFQHLNCSSQTVIVC